MKAALRWRSSVAVAVYHRWRTPLIWSRDALRPPKLRGQAAGAPIGPLAFRGRPFHLH